MGQDELTPKSAEDLEQQITPPSGTNLLEELMKEVRLTFEKLKQKLIEEKFEGAEGFQSVSDIPKYCQLALIGRIKSKMEKKTT